VYHLTSTLLFWFYWAIALGIAGLLIREIWRSRDWKVQLTAALAVIPFIVRVLLLK
jgi:hypothetical protein